MAHFTQENTSGYTDEELAALNAEFGIRLAWFLAEHPDVPPHDLSAWIREFDKEVLARHH